MYFFDVCHSRQAKKSPEYPGWWCRGKRPGLLGTSHFEFGVGNLCVDGCRVR